MNRSYPLRRFLIRATPLAALALLTACTQVTESPAASPAPQVQGETLRFTDGKAPSDVRVVTVAPQGRVQVAAPGRLAWDEDHTSRVYAPYAGRIERLLASVGQRVVRGQALAEVASADIGQAQADARKAEADLSVARAAAQRAGELAQGGVIARKDLQQAEADLARAEAEAARAHARLRQYGVAADRVNQSLALTAPLAGIVVERNANPGAEVRSDVQGPPLFTISEPSSLWAVIDLDERQLGALQPGMTLALRAAAWPEQHFEARVMWIDAAVDPASRTVKVRARVPNPEGKLKAEMFVSAEFAVELALPRLPADAVLQRGDDAVVLAQTGPGRYERRRVRVSADGSGGWLVREGLRAGEQVVVAGGLYLDQLLDAAR